MTEFGVSEAARVLGVSPDTVRRWIDAGQLDASRRPNGRRWIEGATLAAFARSLHDAPDPAIAARDSARNHLHGIVTEVTSDKVMSHVEVQAGPFRVTALISSQAVRDMGLEPGVAVAAVVKATNVSIELPVD